MIRAFVIGLICAIACLSVANAQTCGVLPNTFANGTTADADQVNANFTSLLNCANGALAPLNAPIFTGAVEVGTGGSSSSFTVIGAGSAFTSMPGGAFSLKSFNATTTPFVVNLAAAAPVIADFQDNGSSVLAVANGGRVGVGTTAPTLNLYVNGTAGGTSAWQNLSDERLKKNIVPIEGALSIVEKLQGVRFDWRAPSERTVGKTLNLPVDESEVGFIAQNVKKVLPEAVAEISGTEALASIRESKIIPVLVEAVKELNSQNSALKAANALTAKQVVRLQAEIDRLRLTSAQQTERTASTTAQ